MKKSRIFPGFCGRLVSLPDDFLTHWIVAPFNGQIGAVAVLHKSHAGCGVFISPSVGSGHPHQNIVDAVDAGNH